MLAGSSTRILKYVEDLGRGLKSILVRLTASGIFDRRIGRKDFIEMASSGVTGMPKLLVIDNYDSFTYNLVQMFKNYDIEIRVYRSDKITLDQVEILDPDYVLISPGPKDPAHAGISIPLIRSYCRRRPIFGVCLGLQCINEAFGGRTVRAPVPMHGKTSRIYHDNYGIFSGISSPFTAARYHSLTVMFGQTELMVTSYTQDGVIMGMSHPEFPLHGVQFHPESFLTEHGFMLIENFLRLGPLKFTGFDLETRYSDSEIQHAPFNMS